MNMNDLMKISAGIVLVGSVCESAMCHDYKGAQLVRGLYDSELEKNIAELTVEKIKAEGGNWDACVLPNSVADVAKAIYNGGNWANGAVAFEELTNEAKILVYGIAKATKDHEGDNNNAGWQFFAHMFKSGGLSGDAEGIASVLNAWGEFARGEALGWKQYQDLGDKAGIDAKVLGYSKSAWRCCGMEANSMRDYIAYIDQLVEADKGGADVDDENFSMAGVGKIVANGKRLKAAVDGGDRPIWDGGKLKKEVVAVWKSKAAGEERQKAIAADFINYMGGKVIGEEVKSGYEASACFKDSAVEVVEGASKAELQKLDAKVRQAEADRDAAKKRLDTYTDRMRRMQANAAKYCSLNLMTGDVTGPEGQ